MKLAKKLFAVLLSAALALMVAVPAFAADGDITITVDAAAQGVTYSAYKIFDATISGGENSTISYTIPDDSNIKEAEGFNTVFDTTENGGKTYVTQKGENDAVIAWLKSYMGTSPIADAAATVINTDGATSVTLDVTKSGYGYYYITSTLDSATAVSVTSTNPKGTVVDKRESTPVIDTNDGKKVNGKDVADMEVGDTETFTVQFTATNYVVNAGIATPIVAYSVMDTPNGLTIDQNSVKVTVNGDATLVEDTNWDWKDLTTLTKNQYAVKFDESGNMTVAIGWPQDTYTSPSKIVVSYDATLTSKNLAGDSTNKAKVMYYTDGTTPINVPGDDDDLKTDTYTHSIAITKVDKADNDITLAGAQFVLSKVNENNKTVYYSYDGDDVSWVDSIDDATVKTTKTGEETGDQAGDKGTAVFVGLEHGTYTLTEIKAPDGYNLAEPIPVTVNEITKELTPDANGKYLVLVNPVTVEDASGSTLPETGGMGTTIFYVLGGVLVVGAGILLVTKKRMNGEA